MNDPTGTPHCVGHTRPLQPLDTLQRGAALVPSVDGVPCQSSDCAQAATVLLPQSVDAGKTIQFVARCDACAQDWWDGADWDGRALVSRICSAADMQNDAVGLLLHAFARAQARDRSVDGDDLGAALDRARSERPGAYEHLLAQRAGVGTPPRVIITDPPAAHLDAPVLQRLQGFVAEAGTQRLARAARALIDATGGQPPDGFRPELIDLEQALIALDGKAPAALTQRVVTLIRAAHSVTATGDERTLRMAVDGLRGALDSDELRAFAEAFA